MYTYINIYIYICIYIYYVYIYICITYFGCRGVYGEDAEEGVLGAEVRDSRLEREDVDIYIYIYIKYNK